MEEIKYVVWKYGVYFETLTKREILRKYELTESEFAKRYPKNRSYKYSFSKTKDKYAGRNLKPELIKWMKEWDNTCEAIKDRKTNPKKKRRGVTVRVISRDDVKGRQII